MAASALHFGIDEASRLLVLRHCGIDVLDCEYSIDRLEREVAAGARLLLISEGLPSLDQRALDLAGTRQPPITKVLFQDTPPRLDPSSFELVIPSGTPPNDWLASIQKLLRDSEAIQMETRKLIGGSSSLRLESAALRNDSAIIRNESAAAREESARARREFRNRIDDGKQQNKM